MLSSISKWWLRAYCHFEFFVYFKLAWFAEYCVQAAFGTQEFLEALGVDEPCSQKLLGARKTECVLAVEKHRLTGEVETLVANENFLHNYICS